MQSFLWFDYETSGADAARDRAWQFAAVRTSAELETIGAPINVYCQPVIDVLPHPAACLITRLSPQRLMRDGLPEPEFAKRVLAAYAPAGTVGAGFNSIRFDDEFTRHLLYRTLHDPYELHWRGGNGRWDLLDVVRLMRALRPDGLQWPLREDGHTSFKLEHLAAANGLAHEHAHDALSDVEALIGLARLLRQAQPKLWQHALKLRDKQFAASLLDVDNLVPAVHVSSRFPAQQGCMSIVAPLLRDPRNQNAVICWDLQIAPDDLLELSAEELRERLFCPKDDLPEGMTRPALKGVHLNKSPMLAPLSVLRAAETPDWGIDVARCEAHRQQLLASREVISEKLLELYAQRYDDAEDPELALYGSFFSAADKRRMEQLRSMPVSAWGAQQHLFEDPRLPTLVFRARARFAPWSLSAEERNEWLEWVGQKLTRGDAVGSLTLADYHAEIATLLPTAKDSAAYNLLLDLKNWPEDSGLMDLLREGSYA